MIKQRVNSENADNEGRWILLSICLILLGAFFLLPYHQLKQAHSSLQPHQIALTDIDSHQLVMIAELRIAHEEIRNLHADDLMSDVSSATSENGAWPSPADLAALWIAPFVEDKSWLQQGQHRWQQIAAAVYQGIPNTKAGADALILFSGAKSPDIWIDLQGQSKPFTIGQKTLSTAQLIAAGWSQVIFADSHLTRALHH